MAAVTDVERGRRSTGWGARKAAASSGTRAAPWAVLVQGRHEGGKLGMSHADPRAQVLRHGVQQSAHEAGLAAVELLQAVQADVGRARLRPLHPVADPLQGGEDLLVHPLVGGLVGLQDDGAGVARQGLLQGHAHRNPRRCGEGVDDHGPPA